MASCMASPPRAVFSSDTVNLELFGDVTEKWVHLSHFCSPLPRYVLLPETQSITDARRQCVLTNASLALPTSGEENQRLLDALQGFMDVCAVTNVRKLWLGASDGTVEGKWRIDGTGDLMIFNRFYPPAPNGGTVNNCLVMRSDGAWEDDICDERNKKCAACYYQGSDFLRLRGLCFDNEHQQRFAVTGYMSGKPMYRGYYNLLIHWLSNNTWYLTDTKTNITIATTTFDTATHYPIGRNTWMLHSTICDTPAGDEIELSLSACDDDQYMCRDGECIPSTERCNLRSDCHDGSDEETCNFLLLPKGYRNYLTPVNPETGEKLGLHPHIILTRFDAIEDISMTVSMELKVSLSWLDHRLTFANLQDSQRASLISRSDQDSMWLPDYKFENIYRGNIKTLEETVAVERSSDQLKPEFNRLNMDTLFPGTKNSLTQTKKFIGTFTCDFQLYFYPFDSQLCEIQLQLSTELKDHAVFAFKQGVAEYIGAEHLPLYTVQGVTLRNHTQPALMSVDFILKRRSGIVVLTTFVPTVLLLLVSWATLFVKIENLNVRATMALTSLLVLYTMFSNLSRSLPSTAEIKLIDVWFFFIIFLIFSNIMVHVFAEYLPLHPEERCIKVSSLTGPKSFSKSKISSRSKFTPAKLLKLQRYFIVPFAFLVFSIYFWCKAFLQ
nr:uncharacterized protein LOC123758956 [Procambarus clarkii]